MIGKFSINKLNELNQAYLHKLCTNCDKVYVFRFLRLVLHCCNFEEIWTRPYRDVMIWRTKYNKKWSISTLRETYINWNWLDQAQGRFCRDALYEMNVLYEMWSIVDFKDVIKVGFKVLIWWLNEICCCASFVCWPKMVLVLHLLRSFLKYLCEHPRVRLTFWKLMCWICWHPRVRLKFYVRFYTMNCAGFSYCQIIDWLKFDDEFLPRSFRNFSSFLEWFVVFVEDDDAN